jgi:hypothetical protein
MIEFRIPGAGPHTITLLTLLPQITQPVTITGETEAGWVAATATTAAVLRVELSGGGTLNTGLRINSPNVTVRGLATASPA